LRNGWWQSALADLLEGFAMRKLLTVMFGGTLAGAIVALVFHQPLAGGVVAVAAVSTAAVRASRWLAAS